jgi:hypothetical protein
MAAPNRMRMRRHKQMVFAGGREVSLFSAHFSVARGLISRRLQGKRGIKNIEDPPFSREGRRSLHPTPTTKAPRHQVRKGIVSREEREGAKAQRRVEKIAGWRTEFGLVSSRW